MLLYFCETGASFQGWEPMGQKQPSSVIPDLRLNRIKSSVQSNPD